MDYLTICLVAVLASGLTLFSGFGLGTILTPAFALFFPIPTAIAMTAVVHLSNNLFKIGLVGSNADWRVVARFGVTAALAAIAGASLLALFALQPAWTTYQVGDRWFEITPVKAVVGLLIVAFALLELSPRFDKLSFAPRWMPLGGLLSGFFGGLSGNQGAFRAAFLVKAGLGKEAFIGTSAACAVLVDAVRLVAYGAAFHGGGWAVLQGENGGLVIAATLAAFAGAWFGDRKSVV